MCLLVCDRQMRSYSHYIFQSSAIVSLTGDKTGDLNIADF